MAEALLPVLLDSPVSPVGTLKISLGARSPGEAHSPEEARSLEDRSASPRPAPGAGSVEAVSTHRTPIRFLSE